MRAKEFLSEDIKSRVVGTLSSKQSDDPVFQQVWKVLVGEPLSTRINKYIEARKDQDAINAISFLDKTIPTLGTASEVRLFMKGFQDPKNDYINLERAFPPAGMTKPAVLTDVVDHPFAKKMFENISANFKGKKDAGPGEAALAILSSNITYAQQNDDEESGGDLVVRGVGRVEVKAGTGGRLAWGYIDQKEMTTALAGFKLMKPPLAVKGKKVPPGIQNQNTQVGAKIPMGQEPQPPEENTLAEVEERLMAGVRVNFFNNTPPAGFPTEAFLNAACIAWFGEVRPDILSAVGTPAFSRAWINAIYEQYKLHAKFSGILFLTNENYQYVISGSQIPDRSIINYGYVYYPKAKQGREMAPQVVPLM